METDSQERKAERRRNRADRLTENSGRAASGVPETDAKENSGVTGENGAEASAGPQTADESLPVSVGAEEPGSAAGAPSGGTENGGGQPAAAGECGAAFVRGACAPMGAAVCDGLP
ncbi:MAG: hypothetical protein ACLUOI_36250 [Eisenbergiella sp.]